MKQSKGFTLVELMMVVAVLAIVAAVAYPSYTKTVQKSRRTDARTALQEAAARQERIYAETNTYTKTVAKLVTAADGKSSPEGYYVITAEVSCTRDVNGAPYSSCFDLTATAVGQQAVDTECATFTLSHTGAKGSTGGGDCW